MTAIVLVIGLMFVGLGLLAIELFVIPGFGVVGVLGFLGVGASVFVAYTEISPAYSAIALAGGVVGSAVMFWLLPKTRLGKSMSLDAKIDGAAVDDSLAGLDGRSGVAITALRPAGSVDIDGRPIDVVTDGQWVDSGSEVRVVRVEGSRVVVEPRTSPAQKPEDQANQEEP